MKSTTTKLSDSKIKFEITGTGQEIAPFFDRAAEKLSETLSIKGFRPGKVPTKVAREAIGEHAIEHEAQELAIQDSYYEFVQKEDITPVAPPTDIKISTFSTVDGLIWEGIVEIIPAITITDWKKAIADKKPAIALDEIKATEDEVAQTLSELSRNLATSEEKDGPGEKGDWMKIDIDVAEHAQLTEDQKTKVRATGIGLVLGDSRFIPGFEDHLMGVKAGEKKTFDLTFPSDYFVNDLAALAVPFVVTVQEVKKVILPELDDEFAQKYGAPTLDEMKKQIEDNASTHKRQEAQEAFENELLEALIESITFEAPKALVEQEKDMITSRFRRNVEEKQRIPFNDYLQAIKSDEVQLRESFASQAEKNVRIGLVLGQITREENIDVTDNEIDEMMMADIMQQTLANRGEKVEEMEREIRARYKNEDFVASLKNSIRARKTMDLIVNSTK
ncbi:MAG: trigger factor [Patescibacteria group bacterium]